MKRKIMWTEKEKCAVARLYNKGLSASEIAHKAGIVQSRNVINGLISRMIYSGDDRITRGFGGEWSDDQSLRLLDLRENHKMQFRQISHVVRRTPRECQLHYNEIIRDLDASERR